MATQTACFSSDPNRDPNAESGGDDQTSPDGETGIGRLLQRTIQNMPKGLPYYYLAPQIMQSSRSRSWGS